MKAKDIPGDVLGAIRMRRGAKSEEDDSFDAEIDKEDMDAERLFMEFCEWHGLSGYGIILIEVLDTLRYAEAFANV